MDISSRRAFLDTVRIASIGSTFPSKLTSMTISGMPRILLSTAHITPSILDDLKVKYTSPSLVASYPSLPKPFVATAERISQLQKVDVAAHFKDFATDSLESAKKSFCNDTRSRPVSS